jgi:hypothetical protein
MSRTGITVVVGRMHNKRAQQTADCINVTDPSKGSSITVVKVQHLQAKRNITSTPNRKVPSEAYMEDSERE